MKNIFLLPSLAILLFFSGCTESVQEKGSEIFESTKSTVNDYSVALKERYEEEKKKATDEYARADAEYKAIVANVKSTKEEIDAAKAKAEEKKSQLEAVQEKINTLLGVPSEEEK